jgi:plasmid stabilization system protein ParE
LKETVYPERKANADPKLRQFWWKFRRSNEVYFNAVHTLERFIATVETTEHRVFVFVKQSELLEHGVIGFGITDAWQFGVLSSTVHVCWALANGGTLEDRPRYNKDVCFDPFPFPAANDLQKQRIRAIAEDLDAHRKRVLTEHPHLTLTGLYNVLEKLRAGQQPNTLTHDDRRIFDDGLVLILKEYHDKLDAAVADAYGWPADLSDDEILTRLVALNAERAREESEGLIRWLRPEYQIPRFGTPKDKLALTGGAMHGARVEPTTGPKPAFPTDNVAQTAAVVAALAATTAPVGAEALAGSFRQGRRAIPAISAVLASLVRMGFVATPDGGRTYAMRRVA